MLYSRFTVSTVFSTFRQKLISHPTLSNLLALSLRCSARGRPTGEATLALLLAAGDRQELVREQVEGGRPAVRVRLEAAQDESLGLQRHGLWDLRVDLEHAHLRCASAYR